LQEYEKFINLYNKININKCEICTQKTNFHRHLYYYPFYLSIRYSKELPVLVIKPGVCSHCKAVLPACSFNHRKITTKKKLELTREYITSDLSYKKVADKYGISKSYAYKIVQFFKGFDYHELISRTTQIQADYDIVSSVTKKIPDKPYRLPQTPLKLLHALQSVEIIFNALPVFKSQYKKFQCIDNNILLNVLVYDLKLKIFPKQE